MTSIDKKIVDSQLKEMGLTEEKKRTVSVVRPLKAVARRTSIMDDDFDDGWTPRIQRAAQPRIVQTQRSNQWHRDQVCERLAKMAEGWVVDGSEASMSGRDFEQVVTTLATDFANAMEHAGLIYKTGLAPAILADMVSDFITTQTLVRVGDDYFDVEVGK
jgi:hypothetical protein